MVRDDRESAESTAQRRTRDVRVVDRGRLADARPRRERRRRAPSSDRAVRARSVERHSSNSTGAAQVTTTPDPRRATTRPGSPSTSVATTSPSSIARRAQRVASDPSPSGRISSSPGVNGPQLRTKRRTPGRSAGARSARWQPATAPMPGRAASPDIDSHAEPPRGEMGRRPAPETRPDMEQRRARGSQRGRHENERDVGPAVVERFALERDGHACAGGQVERIEPCRDKRSMIPVRVPRPLGRLIRTGRCLVEPVGVGVVRPRVLVRDGDRGATDRTVAREVVEIVREGLHHRGDLGQDATARTELTPMVGHPELRLMRLADVRRAPIGGRLGVGPAPGQEADRATAEARPGKQAVVRGDQTPGRTGPTRLRIRGASPGARHRLRARSRTRRRASSVGSGDHPG